MLLLTVFDQDTKCIISDCVKDNFVGVYVLCLAKIYPLMLNREP